MTPTYSLDQLRRMPKPVRMPLGYAPLDYLLGGGPVRGTTIVLAGYPGVGKTTLLLQLAMQFPGKVHYVTAEEAPEQMAAKLDRITIPEIRSTFSLQSETSKTEIFAAADEIKPDILILDSLQAVLPKGRIISSVTTVVEVAQAGIDFAKTNKSVVIFIGHVNKGGDAAGPQHIRHMTDGFMEFDSSRVINVPKHRYGPAPISLQFRMDPTGLTADIPEEAVQTNVASPNTPPTPVAPAPRVQRARRVTSEDVLRAAMGRMVGDGRDRFTIAELAQFSGVNPNTVQAYMPYFTEQRLLEYVSGRYHERQYRIVGQV